MITVKLKGGLGNQMFQYALGRTLSLRHKTTLLLDASRYTQDALYPNDTPREYSLHHFKLYPELQVTEKSQYPSGTLEMITRRIKRKIATPNDYMFDEGACNAKDGEFLEGFWQSERYFAEIAPTIRADFALKEPFSDAGKEVVNSIQQCVDSVSIHVRRGDYVASNTANAFHGSLALTYYDQATQLIRKQIPNPQWIVFSDDIPWCRQHFTFLDDVRYVDQPAPDYEQLHLISLCKNHIIANSSFSWWGAWLNPVSSKTVIAPKNWVANSTIDTSAVVPASWVQI